MSVRRWPDKLPAPSTPGYGMQGVDPSLRTQMEVGAQRVRRRTFARLDRIKLQWMMTPFQYAAFSAWFYGAKVSIAGASDTILGWGLTNVTTLAAVAVSPETVLVDRIMETVTTAGHFVGKALPDAAFDNIAVLLRTTLRSAGRPNVRLSLIDRAAGEPRVDVNLATGAVTAAVNVASYSVEDRGGGWWRISLICNTAAGIGTPVIRIRLLDAGSGAAYAGDVTKGIEVCEVQARIPTGYDLFVPADANGLAIGADGGSSWFFVPVPTDAGLVLKEARFTAMFNEDIRPGLNRVISGELEVRYV